MADYPDGTMPVSIIAQAIADLNVDIVAQTIGNLAVDIAAQTLATLGVNIKAQDLAKLAVDIAGQTIGNVGVNIAAQAIGNLAISVAAQTVGVYLQPDWQQAQGNAKFFRVSGSNVASGGSAAANYTVTAGKTLYITHIGGSVYGTNAADRDKDQVCYMNVMNNTTTTILAELGGHGGGGMPLPTPVKIPAGEIFRYQIWNFANHNCEIYFTAGGYEI